MGRFVNPNNSAFQVALNSQIYVDKTGMIAYTNRVLGTMEGYICNSRPRRVREVHHRQYADGVLQQGLRFGINVRRIGNQQVCRLQEASEQIRRDSHRRSVVSGKLR